MDSSGEPCCPDCEAPVGELHVRGCDVEQCPYCGGQLLSCCCPGIDTEYVPDDDRLPWTGEWPGTRECEEFGWYAKRAAVGWVSCAADEPGAGPDLNRLHIEAGWDRENKRFVKKTEEPA